jgi:hypothetical protein
VFVLSYAFFFATATYIHFLSALYCTMSTHFKKDFIRYIDYEHHNHKTRWDTRAV